MRLLPLLFTIFVDSLGFGLVFPIFSPIIINNETMMFAADTSLAMRGWVFGLLVSCFFLGQFFSGPYLGALSDRKGRKMILMLTLLLGFFGYSLLAAAIFLKSITLLFIGRILAGISAGNFSVAQSMVADVSKDEEKAKNFGLVGMAWGVGFIIGPYLGGKLSDPSFPLSFGWTTSFHFAALLCIVNIFLFFWKAEETLSKPQESHTSFWGGMKNMQKAFQVPQLRGIFLAMTIFSIGWGFFTEFIPLYLIRYMELDIRAIGNFYAWVGIWMAVCQGGLIRPFLKRYSPAFLLLCSLLCGAMVLPLMFFVRSSFYLFALMPFISFFEAFITPTSTTLVSNICSKEAQGEMLGIYNSLQCVAYGIIPLFSGSIGAIYPHLPITVGSICMLGSFLLFFWFLKMRSGLTKKHSPDIIS